MSRPLSLLPLLASAVFGFACDGEPSPVVVGHVESRLSAEEEISFEINGSDHGVTIEENGRFSVMDLPTGELVLTIHSKDVRGELRIRDVLPGELIEVSVSIDPDHLEISIVRREPMVVVEPIERNGDFVIEGNHMIHYLAPGLYDGDLIIRGDHITVAGPTEDCEHGAIFTGELRVEGNHINLIGISTLRGRTLRGDHIDVYGGCTDLELDEHRVKIRY